MTSPPDESAPEQSQPIDDPAIDESSIADPPPTENAASSSFAVTFEVVECTNKGKPKLIDNRGYSYGVKRRRTNATDWVCTKRTKLNPCKASVMERADGVYKIGSNAHNQLMTVNAFVRKDDHAKQVPLLFVLMSGRNKGDYREVLKKILEIVPSAPAVKQITLDFEQATWAALREVFPDAKLHGCVFHWTQALWRKVQDLGLQSAYHHDRGTHAFIRKMMALPFLPEKEIQPMFQSLQRSASAPLLEFTEYVSSTWINGTTWSPADWTAFKKAVRTNNDLEGWHHALNRRASGRGQLPMYLLIQLLHREAMLTAVNIRLVSENKLKRIQRRKYRELQKKIFELWDEYEADERSAKRLLKACSHLNGPREK
ncbi:hypothetical protein ACROYT_G036599 [Oculina patagonica]